MGHAEDVFSRLERRRRRARRLAWRRVVDLLITASFLVVGYHAWRAGVGQELWPIWQSGLLLLIYLEVFRRGP